MATHKAAFPVLLLGSGALAFGPLLVRMADVAPVASAFWRMALAVPVLLLIARGRGEPLPGGRALPWVAAGGALFAADLAAWHLGIARTTVANATLFGNVTTFFLAAYGFWLARAWPGARFAAALAMAAAGAGLLLGRSFELSERHFAGDLLSLLAGLFYTGYFIVIERVRRASGGWATLAVVSLAGALALAPVALAFGGRVWPGDWTPLVALALGSQVFGQGLIVYAVGHLRPEVSGLGLLVQPVIAALVGWWALGEAVGPWEVAGGVLVLGALALARTGRGAD